MLKARNNEGVPIKNVNIGRYNEEIMRNIIDAIFSYKGTSFKVNAIAKLTGYKGQKIARYMPHLVESGCVKEIFWNNRYANQRQVIKRANIRYRKIFTPDDVEEKLAVMKKLEEERDRSVMHLR